MSYVLSAVDTSAIQHYIFGSNRLREHIGASELVLQATSQWIWETLTQEGLRTNWNAETKKRDDSKQIEIDDHNLDAEVIYASGGNALILFKDADRAKSWARRLSTKALTDAPGLTLLIAHSAPFEWQTDSTDLADRVADLFSQRLDHLKRNRLVSTPLLGVGVTATCQSTGLTAVATDTMDSTHPMRVSREVVKKTNMVGKAQQRFKILLSDYDRLGIELPTQLDHLNPHKGERSYIAVVHADGNGIGKRFQTIWQNKKNRDGITAVRFLSDTLSALASTALSHALGSLITPLSQLITPYKNFFPVRPLIYGGDDLTIVCDGRIGVGLAARYLHEFEQRSRQYFPGEQLSAAAGIAIVKTHYPFARAYELSEELCKKAKTLSRETSTLDWHVAMSGTLGDVKQIRQREFRVHSGKLEMRPVYLQEAPNIEATKRWRTWAHIEEIINAFHKNEAWTGKRNKIKQLRDVLRNGDDAVTQFLAIYQMHALPGYYDATTLKTAGWRDRRCGYFDAIELLDLYIPPALSAIDMEAQWLPIS